MLSNNTFDFALYEATKTGQDSVVIKLLKQRVNPSNYKDPLGNTALHIAVMQNNPHLVAILLENNAGFLQENNAQKNPLELATDSKHWECILEFGKYNEKNLSLAEELGNPVVTAVDMGKDGEVYVRELLRGNINLNNWSVGDRKHYALHVAASQNSVHMVELLASKGANISIKNKAKQTPALLAAKKGNWGCVDILMQYRDSKAKLDDQFDQVLLYAVAAGQTDLVRALLMQGVSPNYVGHKKNTALHIAIRDKNPEIIALLLAHNADLQKQNRKKSTPLNLLTDSEYWDGIAEFAKYNQKKPSPEISHALNILLINTLKTKPIREDYVAILLKGKTLVNGAQDPETKQTALHIAAANNLPHVVLALLKAGADMTAVDGNGDTAVTLAAKSKNWACVKVLARFKNNTCAKFKDYFDRALLLAVQANQSDAVEDLLKAGANPNNTQSIMPGSQNTPLHEAACLKNAHLMGLLLKFHAQVNLKNIAGETAVDITAKLHDWSNLDIYTSRHYFSREKAREILFILLVAGEGQKQSSSFALLPPEIRELIFQYAFSAFAPPNGFNKYLADMQNGLLLSSIKALHQHITVQSQKKPGFFSATSIKIPPEIKELSQQLFSVCEEISSSQTKVDACHQLIADFIAKYPFEPSWSPAGIDLLIRFHLVDPSYSNYGNLSVYIRQVNLFRHTVGQTSRDSLPVVNQEPIVNILCQQLKTIYDLRGDSHPSTVEEQMKKRIKIFVDRYGQVKEAMTLLAQFELLPKQSIFASLAFRS